MCGLYAIPKSGTVKLWGGVRGVGGGRGAIQSLINKCEGGSCKNGDCYGEIVLNSADKFMK